MGLVPLPLPIDQRTNDVKLGASWTNPRAMFRVGWDRSFFNNQFQSMVWDNPIFLTDYNNGLPPTSGPYDPSGYSNGLLFEGGSLLFIAGQVGWDRDHIFVSDDFAAQFAQALENVLAVVHAAGGVPENIARLAIYVTDKKEYLSRLRDVGSAYRQLMGKHFPAMTLVEVSGLLEGLAKVEIEATAVLPVGSQAAPHTPAPAAGGGDAQ